MEASSTRYNYNSIDLCVAGASVGALAFGYSVPATLAVAGTYFAARQIQNQFSISQVPAAEAAPASPLKTSEPKAPRTESLGSSPWKYLGAAVLTAIAAAAIFFVCPPLGIVLALVAGWFLCACAAKLLSHACKDSDSWAAKAIHWIHAMMIEVHAGIAAAALFPCTLSQKFHEPAGDLKGRPILMINGYLSFGSTWYYQRKKLVEAGFGPIYTMNIGSFNSIETYARQVQEQVKKIQEETGRKDLALICHSKGGLVGSYYATHLAAADEAKVTDVVTIGSPLSGTPLAKLGLGKDAEQMQPDHPFHLNLREEIENHPEIRFFHIASETDEVVPLESALIPTTDPSRQRVFKDLGHLSLVFSSRTADQVSDWLKG